MIFIIIMQYVWGKNGNNNIYETDYYGVKSHEKNNAMTAEEKEKERGRGEVETLRQSTNHVKWLIRETHKPLAKNRVFF